MSVSCQTLLLSIKEPSILCIWYISQRQELMWYHSRRRYSGWYQKYGSFSHTSFQLFIPSTCLIYFRSKFCKKQPFANKSLDYQNLRNNILCIRHSALKAHFQRSCAPVQVVSKQILAIDDLSIVYLHTDISAITQLSKTFAMHMERTVFRIFYMSCRLLNLLLFRRVFFSIFSRINTYFRFIILSTPAGFKLVLRCQFILFCHEQS